MASPLTHALVGATLAAACHFPWKLWVVGVASALLPDLDAAGYWLGVPYGTFWGHRGFTHSIVFAVLASGLFARWISCWTGMSLDLLCCRHAFPWHSGCHDGWWAGSGLSPMDQNRYFLPIRTIHVAAMSLRGLLGPHGLDVLASECQ